MLFFALYYLSTLPGLRLDYGVVMVKKAVYRLSGYKVYLVKADSLEDALAIAEKQGYVVFSGEYVTDSQAAKIIHEVAYNGTRAMVLS